jgi:CRISPR/Cas system-associated exonuclease Cas4 (RecB family)
MESFLGSIADLILEKYPEKTGQLCVVTPNRRAGYFLQNHFAKKVNRPMWAPAFLSIEDFANRISGYHILDHTSLLFEFYEIYRTHENDHTDSLPDFLNWAGVLLRDFDEIESSLENPEGLYSYLNDAKRLENWNPDGAELTGFQKRHLAFFEKFNLWHTALKNKLEAKNLAFQGMSFSKAAQLIKTKQADLPWQKVIFAGFNALNPSEERIIHTLLKEGVGEIFCDSDPYYENNANHEAGHFIRLYRKKWNITPLTNPSTGFHTTKKIRIFGIARNVLQAQLAGNLLDECPEISSNIETAVVLANESLLGSVLQAIPQRITSLNVTMGFPLRQTNLYGFLEALFQLQLSAGRYVQARNENNLAFYYKDLIRFFSNPCTWLLWVSADRKGLSETLLQKIGQSNRTLYRFSDLINLFGKDSGFDETFSFLSKNWNEPGFKIIPELSQILSKMEQAIREKSQATPDELQASPFLADYEGLFYVGRILQNLGSIVQVGNIIESAGTFWQILKQSLADTRIAFSGEPVEGLQVMGLLETRNLDFKNIILLSTNEKVLPKAKTFESFIPFDVKRKFGLLVHSDQDAIYAYHFYRLLQRAENVFLIYNTESGGLGGGEKSRFITQLQFELRRFNPGITLDEQIVSLDPGSATRPWVISIQKSQEVLDRLSQMAETGISVSSLNTFITCPLQFYFEKVARLTEAQETEETLEASTMGSVIHGVLEELFKQFEGKVLQYRDVDEMFPKIEALCVMQFSKHYPEGEINRGKNLLLVNLAKHQISRFLKIEKEFLTKLQQENRSLTILKTEASLQGSIQILVAGHLKNIAIAGKADRIDRLRETIRIIDYKTGKVEPRDLLLKSIDDLVEEKGYDKIFQLLTYTWMFRQMQSETNVESGIVSLRNLTRGFMRVKSESAPESEFDLMESYQTQLVKLLEEMFDPQTAFEQTPHRKNCSFCPFTAVCGRLD